MKNSYTFPIFFFLTILTHSLFAQTGWTVYNSSNSVLSATYYSSVCIDAAGTVWAGGSYSGLCKLTGTTWSRYTASNSTLKHDDVKDMLIDNAGKIWVATYKGVSVFNGTTFTNYDSSNTVLLGSTVYTLGKDNTGKIWLASKNGSFGYQGITTYDGTNWVNLTGYPSQINGKEFPDFTFTSAGDAWLASESGIVKYNSSFTFYPKATTGLWSSRSIAVDAGGNIWAGGFDGILKNDGTNWSFLSSTTDLGLTSNTGFFDIFPDGNILWIAGSKGLIKFDRLSGTIISIYNNTNSPLTGNVYKIAKDSNGNLWLAGSDGVYKMNPTLVGINEPTETNAVSIYPNPSKGIFHINLQNQTELTYKIYSFAGVLVDAGKSLTGNAEIDLGNAPSGIYFVSFTGSAIETLNIKLIKY